MRRGQSTRERYDKLAAARESQPQAFRPEPRFVDELLSDESLEKTGYFEPQAVRHWGQAYRTMRAGSPQRITLEMGLVGVVATQLWHHTFLDGSLANLPSLAASPVRACAAPAQRQSPAACLNTGSGQRRCRYGRTGRHPRRRA